MRGELVALDLETTGLDVENDSIIEVGAVRIRNGNILDEYNTLINPGFEIPSQTTHITGIHQDDLRDKPMLARVLPDIEAFVGDAPVIAHNVSFDISFMRRFGVLKNNLPLDTFELASILLPRAARYSLSSLAETYDIDLEHAHRALDDARATAILYWNLWEAALKLPYYILQEISQGAQVLGWQTGRVFQAALDEVKGTQDNTKGESVLDLFSPLHRDTQPLQTGETTRMLDTDDVVAQIDTDGRLANRLEQYERRSQQIDMTRAITDAFNEGQHLIVEAGTGTGKSIAYLVPALMWAAHNQQRVVISTNTINLQDQLISKDVPLIQDALGLDVNTAVMKGRGNYLCPRRLATMRQRQPGSIDELRTIAKILVWLQESNAGDKNEISLRSGEYFVWNRLSAEDEGCTMHRCKNQMEGICPFYKARKQAEAAHIIVANHALLISDARTNNHVLPNYEYLIIDEAHQLEDAITYGMSQRIAQRDLLQRLNELGSLTRGLLGDILITARNHLTDPQIMRLEDFIQNTADVVRDARIHTRNFFQTVYDFIEESGAGNNYKIQLDEQRREHHAFMPVRDRWQTLDEYLDAITDALDHIDQAIEHMTDESNLSEFDDHLTGIQAQAKNLHDSRIILNGLIAKPESNMVYWINNASSPDWLSLELAPLHIGAMMEEYIWNAKRSAILTSATLQTAETFDHLKERLYADDVRVLAVGSPFDYRSSTLVYVPEDIPMPADRGYQKAVEKGIIELAAALDGRVMALFTSYSQLRETAANIAPRLAFGNITVYDQATGGSRESLLDSFKSTDKAVLLGTRSFWEGVDIPGADLSALVIVRLPFAVPYEPIFAARSATYKNSFREYAVPDAILRFRQGFGRLIRTHTDRGIVAIFDSRVINKSYGTLFLDSLPECTIQYGKLDDLADTATQWLD